jgi:hypothetical protein
MDGSFKEFLQMAQVSAQMSQDHIVTAFHFLISKRGAELDDEAVSSLLTVPSSIAATSTSLFSSAIIGSIFYPRVIDVMTNAMKYASDFKKVNLLRSGCLE